jgi:hypothetical protein
MKLTERHYPEWKAPSQDSEPLIWPEPAVLLQQTRENHAALSHAVDVSLQNVPLAEVRSALRTYLDHPNDRLLIATGHQTELYHPGVWAKHALINAAAEKLDAAAYHIAVDTDAPKHLQLRWPGESLPITDDPNLSGAAWSGQLSLGTPAHLDELKSHLHGATKDWPFKPAAGGVLDSLKQMSIDSPSLSAAIVNATHELDWSLGLRHHAVLASPIFMSDVFLLFAYDLLAHAVRFSHGYNSALDEYRRLHNMKTNMRPMPDLFIGEESIEAPFWLDDLSTGSRTRPSVFARDDGFVLEMVNGEEFHFDPNLDGWEAARSLRSFLVSNQQRLAPRALTLTLFLRLCLVDNFVHGIGGGRYDQVTDRLIETYYHLDPPHFAVSTATMYLPQALTRQRICLPCLVHEGHQLKHRVLGEEKSSLVKQIATLPRHSLERGRLFAQMHGKLRAGQNHPVLSRWRDRLQQAQLAEADNQVFFDRELFYAMQPRERLLSLIARYRESFE